MPSVFIAGTDTDCGKTVVATALLQAFAASGMTAVGYKPIASGAEHTPQGLRNSDAQALQRYSHGQPEYSQICAYTFAPAIAPHAAAMAVGVDIDEARLHQGLAQLKGLAEWQVVEGAGGWYTPISDQRTLADWVADAEIATILVVGLRLGCINHALLSAEAIRRRLPLVGWVANHSEVMAAKEQTIAALELRLGPPLWHQYDSKSPAPPEIPHQLRCFSA